MRGGKSGEHQESKVYIFKIFLQWIMKCEERDVRGEREMNSGEERCSVHFLSFVSEASRRGERRHDRRRG